MSAALEAHEVAGQHPEQGPSCDEVREALARAGFPGVRVGLYKGRPAFTLIDYWVVLEDWICRRPGAHRDVRVLFARVAESDGARMVVQAERLLSKMDAARVDALVQRVRAR